MPVGAGEYLDDEVGVDAGVRLPFRPPLPDNLGRGERVAGAPSEYRVELCEQPDGSTRLFMG
ncbi:hypothetical protein ACWDF9_08100 [Streptomyces rubiginosohelvolus]